MSQPRLSPRQPSLESTPPADAQRPAPRAPPIGTLLSLGVLAYVGAELVQEALGHGLACVLGGGEWRGFSSAWSVCNTSQMGDAATRWTYAAGTVASLVVGGLGLAWLRWAPPRSGNATYGLWLFSAVCLFLGAGELMFLPVAHYGDWEEVLRGPLEGRAPRLLGCALGVALAAGSFAILGRQLVPLLPGGDEARRQRAARWLCWLPFAAVGCVLMTAAAFLNVLGLHHALTTSLSTVGSTSLLIWLPFTLVGNGQDAVAVRPLVERRWLWGAGLLLAIFTLLALGPGIPLTRG